MAVTINLREVFATDSQEVIVDKLTFNFNQLLSLGVGAPGIQGIQGDLGPIGPLGIQGNTGIRGSYAFAGSDPGTITDPIIDGDLFYDIDDFVIQQYHATDSPQWQTIIDINQLVVNAVNASPVLTPTFVKFPVYDTLAKEIIGFTDETSSPSPTQPYRDTLFLSNFDFGKTIWDDSNTGPYTNYYTIKRAMLSLYSDGADTHPITERYAIILGSTNSDLGSPPTEFADLYKTMRIKHYYQYNGDPLSNLNYAYVNFKMSESTPSNMLADTGAGFYFAARSAMASFGGYASITSPQAIWIHMGAHGYLESSYGASITPDPSDAVISDGITIRKSTGGTAYGRFGLGGTLGVSDLIIDAGASVTAIKVNKDFLPHKHSAYNLGTFNLFNGLSWKTLAISTDINHMFLLNSTGQMLLNTYVTTERANVDTNGAFDLRTPISTSAVSNQYGIFMTNHGNVGIGPVTSKFSQNDWENSSAADGNALVGYSQSGSRSFHVYDNAVTKMFSGTYYVDLSGVFVHKLYSSKQGSPNQINNAIWASAVNYANNNTTLGSWKGIHGEVGHDSSITAGTNGATYAIYGYAFNKASGASSVTELIGVRGESATTFGSTTTSGYGGYFKTSNAQYGYGIYVDAHGFADNWGIYQVNTSKNYFAGNIGVQVLDPLAQLHIYNSSGAKILIQDLKATQSTTTGSGGTLYIYNNAGYSYFDIHNTFYHDMTVTGNNTQVGGYVNIYSGKGGSVLDRTFVNGQFGYTASQSGRINIYTSEGGKGGNIILNTAILSPQSMYAGYGGQSGTLNFTTGQGGKGGNVERNDPAATAILYPNGGAASGSIYILSGPGGEGSDVYYAAGVITAGGGGASGQAHLYSGKGGKGGFNSGEDGGANDGGPGGTSGYVSIHTGDGGDGGLSQNGNIGVAGSSGHIYIYTGLAGTGSAPGTQGDIYIGYNYTGPRGRIGMGDMNNNVNLYSVTDLLLRVHGISQFHAGTTGFTGSVMHIGSKEVSNISWNLLNFTADIDGLSQQLLKIRGDGAIVYNTNGLITTEDRSGDPGLGLSIIAGASDDVAGEIIISGGAGLSGGAAGSVNIYGGTSTTGDSGSVVLLTTTSTTNVGNIIIHTGAHVNSVAGYIDLYTAIGSGTTHTGNINLHTGLNNATGASGELNLYTGTTVSTISGRISIHTGSAINATGTGEVNLYTGDTDSGTSGTLQLFTGTSYSGGDSGPVYLQTGGAEGGGNSGNIYISTGASDSSGSGEIYIETGVGDSSIGAVYLQRSTGNTKIGGELNGSLNVWANGGHVGIATTLRVGSNIVTPIDDSIAILEVVGGIKAMANGLKPGLLISENSNAIAGLYLDIFKTLPDGLQPKLCISDDVNFTYNYKITRAEIMSYLGWRPTSVVGTNAVSSNNIVARLSIPFAITVTAGGSHTIELVDEDKIKALQTTSALSGKLIWHVCHVKAYYNYFISTTVAPLAEAEHYLSGTAEFAIQNGNDAHTFTGTSGTSGNIFNDSIGGGTVQGYVYSDIVLSNGGTIKLRIDNLALLPARDMSFTGFLELTLLG